METSWPDGELRQYTYDRGIMTGPGVDRLPSGIWSEGYFVVGQRNGEWKSYSRDGIHWRTLTYLEGELHGPSWQKNDVCSTIARAPCIPCADVGSYANGQKSGHWKECEFYRIVEGPYVDGVRHGEWKFTRYRTRVTWEMVVASAG